MAERLSLFFTYFRVCFKGKFMKTTILIIAYLSGFFATKAQFAPVGAEWNYTSNLVKFINIKSVKDTIVP